MPTGTPFNFATFFVIILYVGVPLGIVFVIFRVIRNGRNMTAEQQHETQRLLREVIELLRENNRLLAEARAARPPER